MKILITGGCGFIGSHVLLELLAQDKEYEILVIDNLSNSKESIINKIIIYSGKNVEFSKTDLRNESKLYEVIKKFKPEIIFHFAGLKSVAESEVKPELYFEHNVNSTEILLKILNMIGCDKIIFSSSATVYGDPVYLPYDEKHPTNPTNNYGKTKLICENLIKDWTNKNLNRCSIILRYFNPVGAHSSGFFGENPRGIPNNLFPIISKTAIGEYKKFKIYGNDYETKDGTAERDYIHVMDLAKAHIACINLLFNIFKINVFNIGVGESKSVLEVLSEYEKVCDKKIFFEFAKKRSGDLAIYWADPSLSFQKINWKPKYSLKDACEHSWKWYQNNS